MNILKNNLVTVITKLKEMIFLMMKLMISGKLKKGMVKLTRDSI